MDKRPSRRIRGHRSSPASRNWSRRKAHKRMLAVLRWSDHYFPQYGHTVPALTQELRVYNAWIIAEERHEQKLVSREKA